MYVTSRGVAETAHVLRLGAEAIVLKLPRGPMEIRALWVSKHSKLLGTCL